MIWFYARTWRYQRVHGDYRSFLRDEEGLLNGPGAKAGLTWRRRRVPDGRRARARTRAGYGKLVKLRVPRANVDRRRRGASARPNECRIRPRSSSPSSARDRGASGREPPVPRSRCATTPFRARGLSRVRREPLSARLRLHELPREACSCARPSSESKLWLAKVLVDEYGEGSEAQDHATLYGRFLRACGQHESPIDRARAHVRRRRTRSFAQHRRIVTKEPFLVGLGAVGPGHEWAIPKMFAAVIPGLQRAGFRDDEIHYFTLHVAQDVDHGAWLEEALARIRDTEEARRRSGAARCSRSKRASAFGAACRRAVVRYRQPRAARPDGPSPRSLPHEIALDGVGWVRVSRSASRRGVRAFARARCPTLTQIVERGRSMTRHHLRRHAKKLDPTERELYEMDLLIRALGFKRSFMDLGIQTVMACTPREASIDARRRVLRRDRLRHEDGSRRAVARRRRA